MGHWIENPPPALARLKTAEGIEGMWREIASKIYSPRVLNGLPTYLERIAFAFWQADPMSVPNAIRNGDVALFIALLIRLDQIDYEMVRAERTEGERAPVLYARHLIEGMRQAAEDQLRRRGGVWPPHAVDKR